MRVARLELHQIGPFDDATFDFPDDARTFLFEGPNGSGKTTVAHAIANALCLRADGQTARGTLSPPALDARTRQPGAEHVLGLEHELATCEVHFGATHGRWIEPSAAPANLVAAFHYVAQLSAREQPGRGLAWAAFGFGARAPSVTLSANGPMELDANPLQGALSFGTATGRSNELGQFLMNMEFDRIQAREYFQSKSIEEFRTLAASREATLARFERAISQAIDRRVEVRFPLGQRAPVLTLDGEAVPIDVIGEGLRNTLSWLSSLMVRLERIPWADASRSPFDQDFWLLLDEVEESLHPTMQLRLFPVLRELFPNAILYATTHSPFVVASVTDGYVFSIEPDPKTRHVSGPIAARRLGPGRSLDWVLEAVFGTPTGIVDAATREKLEVHQRAVHRLRGGAAPDWAEFLVRRRELVALNEEVAAIVRVMEAPVRAAVDAQLAGAAA